GRKLESTQERIAGSGGSYGSRFPMSQMTILAAQAAHFSRFDDEVQDVSSDEENKADDNKADA
ncbi:hypothetical protein Tco_0838119, partial [Tanacetum coccineum]